jgi:phospholipase/lecithinase/hemolysin
MQNGQAISGLVEMMVHDNIAAQAALLPTVQGQLYDADVQIFDTYSLFSELLDNPVPTFGVKFNVESWCHYCLTGECHLCPQPDEYMFMDDLHPTQKVHEVMAARLSEFIGLPYAPEP